ncbi:MAG: glycoside hydrolase family 2 protein, partial [Promethearchaeota archaeon]
MVDFKRITISDTFWKFRYGLGTDDPEDMEDPGMTNKWYNGFPEDQDILKVYVPSSWSYYQNRENFSHFGTGWYETSFFMPFAWGSADGKKISLVFNGSNYRTTVWINGKKIGYHEGGFTKFWFEINDYVKFGKDNNIVIQVDNRYLENRLPWTNNPDWMNYGGVFRPVYLKLSPKVCIDNLKITNHIEFAARLGEGSENAIVTIHARLNIKDTRSYTQKFDGSIVMTCKNNNINKIVEKQFNIVKGGGVFVDLELEIPDSHLWTPEDPYLYDLLFQLIDKRDRRELDREAARWGIRDFKIDGKNFYLNNERLILRGINYHEDHPDVGSSMNPRLIYNDLNIMKECHINCIRTAHCPPYESLISMADELGFLVLEEIPVYLLTKEQYKSEYLITAHQQLWEMIHQDKNHCSVVAWIISSECELESKEGYDFMKNLIDLTHELDPFRYVSLVADNPLKESQKIKDLVDFLCINEYLGWYEDLNLSKDKLSQTLDHVWEIYSKGEEKPLVIAEFGAGAIEGYKSFANAHWSENYQAEFLETYLSTIHKKDYIGGACVWHFQDFRCSSHADFHDRPKEYNNKGIVDTHRNPKMGYFVVQE